VSVTACSEVQKQMVLLFMSNGVELFALFWWLWHIFVACLRKRRKSDMKLNVVVFCCLAWS